jgi:hypothetical protein
MTAVRRLRAVLDYGTKKDIARLVVVAKTVRARVADNTGVFVSPSPSLASLESATAALSSAQDAVDQRQPGAVAARNAARDALLTILEGLRAYVQTIADASEQPAVVIEAAGMAVARVSTYVKPLLGARLGVGEGVVMLVAAAGQLSKSKRYKTYGWQVSVDGGRTWTLAPSTPVAHTTLSGLPALTVCSFRVNVTDTTGTTEWSQAVGILVH